MNGLLKKRFNPLEGPSPVNVIKSLSDEINCNDLAQVDKLVATCTILNNLGDGIVYNENEAH